MNASKYFLMFLPFYLLIGCGELNDQLKVDKYEPQVNSLSNELEKQLKEKSSVASVRSSSSVNKNFMFGDSEKFQCLATWAVGGASTGVISANILSKACTGTGLVAGVLTAGGGLALAATCATIDISEIDTLAGMLTGGAIASLQGLRSCTSDEKSAIEQDANFHRSIPVLESKKQSPVKRGLDNSIAARQKKQAQEDRKAAAAETAIEHEKETLRKIDELIGSQRDRQEAAAARLRNRLKSKN